MKIGDRIAQRRRELGMTQMELALKLGYTSKTTINKVELGINDVSQSKVVLYAEALDTTVQYLMGWEGETISPTKRKLLDAVDTMDEEQIEKLLKLIEIVKEM